MAPQTATLVPTPAEPTVASLLAATLWSILVNNATSELSCRAPIQVNAEVLAELQDVAMESPISTRAATMETRTMDSTDHAAPTVP